MIGPHIEVGEVVTVKSLCFSNELGGTETMKRKVRVRITKGWEDYECGWRFHATLLDKADIDRVRKARKLEAKTMRLAKKQGIWKPRPFENKVYVSEFDIIAPVLKKIWPEN